MPEQIKEQIENIALPIHQLVSLNLETEEAQYLGPPLLTEDQELQGRFLFIFTRES